VKNVLRGFLRENPAVKRIKPKQHLNQQTLERHLKMNNQSPLIPQGSLLEQKNQSRTRVKIAVFVVLAIHGIGLMALLMQGCQKPPEIPPPPAEPTNAAPAFVEPTNPPPAANAVVAPANPTVVESPRPPAPPAGETEYTIGKGDNFSALAKKFHVSLKAMTDANPGVEPTKLKVGQKIHIPPTNNPAASAAIGAGSPENTSTIGEQSYAVKSGDTLSSIAKEKGTTIKALRAANSLKTDRITVGQKLKIPVKATPPATAPAAPAEPVPGTSTSAPPTVPPAR
jgi:LysM repeat protein